MKTRKINFGKFASKQLTKSGTKSIVGGGCGKTGHGDDGWGSSSLASDCSGNTGGGNGGDDGWG